MSPHSIAGKDVVRLIPRLRFSSRGKEQLQANKSEQKAECGDFKCQSPVGVFHAEEYNGSSLVWTVQLQSEGTFSSLRASKEMTAEPPKGNVLTGS